MPKSISKMNKAELLAYAKKQGVEIPVNVITVPHLRQFLTQPSTTVLAEAAEVVSHLHHHPDANNFGASHNESEARKAQKRADNGYTGL